MPPLLPVLAAAAAASGSTAPSFTIANDEFMKDGKAFTIRSGSLHYSRVPPAYWADRMQRMKALGLNTVTTYVPWNYHETTEGHFNFTGNADVESFLSTAQKEGMLVLMRPGPYMCGEWEFGGLPAWLLMNSKLKKIRTYDAEYIAAVDKFWGNLLPRFRTHLYSAGGPIIMLQLENEYGSFGNCASNEDDAQYMRHLYNLSTGILGTDVIYSTIQGANDLAKASPFKGDARVFATVDGGISGSYTSSWPKQKAFNAPGNSPKMWTELWTGWFTPWGAGSAANKSSTHDGNGVAEMVSEGASFSLYMAHGGTSFGFWSGANGGGASYTPDITSYDYNAPIGEAGDHTIGSDGKDIFAAVRDAIAAKFGAPPAEPAPVPKRGYGAATLTESTTLFGNLGGLVSCSRNVGAGPLPTMEALKQNYGLVLYSRDDSSAFDKASLQFSGDTMHDRAQVFVDGAEAGAAYRPDCGGSCSVAAPAGRRLDILVENMGRVNFGSGMYDYKGIDAAPPLAGNWTARCIELHPEQVRALPFAPSPPPGACGRDSFPVNVSGVQCLGLSKAAAQGADACARACCDDASCAVWQWCGSAADCPGAGDGAGCWTGPDASQCTEHSGDRWVGGARGGASPVFHRGELHVADAPRDTYLDTRGLNKGLMWVNGIALGRYWETAGPQHALYVPAPFLRTGSNELIVLDLHGAAPGSVQSVAAQRWS